MAEMVAYQYGIDGKILCVNFDMAKLLLGLGFIDVNAVIRTACRAEYPLWRLKDIEIDTLSNPG